MDSRLRALLSEENTMSFPRRKDGDVGSTPSCRVIPANWRESTIPAVMRRREFTVGNSPSTTPAPEKSTPSFPQRRESIPAVIPAEVEIYPIRHSREGGNPQFPRMREFIDPLPRHLRKILRHSRKDGNDVEVVLRGNEVSGRSGWCFFVEFPRTRELWIPAFAGMTEYFRVPSRE